MNAISKPDSSLPSFLTRRSFLRRSGMLAALSPAAVYMLGNQEEAGAALPFAPGTELDIAILNFALNLEYLEGEYYTRGVTGVGLAASGIPVTNGTTPAGTVITKPTSTAVPFQSAVLAQYAAEIAQDEQNHIKFIQNTIDSLGGTPVSEPTINLLDSFNIVANNAGISSTFDPFENEVNFYLGAYSLTDVGVTAYLGAGPLLTNKAVLKGASGILAVEAYHDSTIRLTVFNAGTDAQTKAQKVSDLRDMLDDNGKTDKDQGVANADGTPNIVPTDANSLAFPRSARQVLNIVYGGYKAANGLFFPQMGLNGDIK